MSSEVRRSARNSALRGLLASAVLVAIGAWVSLRFASGRAPLSGAILFGAVGLGGASLLPRFLRRYLHFEETPAILGLAHRGLPLAMAAEIDEDFEMDSRTFTVGWVRSVTVSDEWLLHRRAFGIDLIDLDDLGWAYAHTLRSYNFGFPIGTDHSVTIRLIHGGDYSIPCRESQAHALLREIGRRNTDAHIGWDAAFVPVFTEMRRIVGEPSTDQELNGHGKNGPA